MKGVIKLSSVCLPCTCLSVRLPLPRSGSSVFVSLRLSGRAALTLALCSTGGRVKTWKRRWFILTDNCLYYFEYTTVRSARVVAATQRLLQHSVVVFAFIQDKEPRGIIPLENLSIKEVEDKKPVSTAPPAGAGVDGPARWHFFFFNLCLIHTLELL